MTVYVVKTSEGDGDWIHGVYDTREAAEQHAVVVDADVDEYDVRHTFQGDTTPCGFLSF